MDTQKLIFHNAYLSVSAVMFCKQCLALLYTLIGVIMLSINIHVGFNIYVLTTCIVVFRGSTSSFFVDNSTPVNSFSVK